MSFFLDSTGLAHFWNKAKEYIKSKYVGINDKISISSDSDINQVYIDENEISIKDYIHDGKVDITPKQIHVSLMSYSDQGVYISPYGINLSGNTTIGMNNITTEEINAKHIKRINGTNKEVLLGDGSVAYFNIHDGVPKLDANGKLDSSQIDALTDAEIDTIVV